MTPKKPYHKDLSGQRFGKLVVLGFHSKRGVRTYWLCQCDCGIVKPIRSDGFTGGRVTGCGCQSICFPQPPRNGWIENGVGYIPLTRGQIAEVDAADVEDLQRRKWQAHKKRSGKYYAECDDLRVNGKKRKLDMGRYLMGLDYGDPRQVDHIDLNTLNNKRSNLRIGTQAQNLLNKRVRKDNRIGVKGVFRNGCKSGKIYSSKIIYKGVYYGLGSSDNIAELAQRYAEMSRKLHGEFGRTE